MSRLVHFWVLSASILVQIGSFGAALSLSPSPPKGLSYDAIAKLARKRYQNDNDGDSLLSPMKGRVAVITGAAGGIGGELSKIVYRLGGTVVALDRNTTGLESLQKIVIDEHSNDNDGEKDRIVILPTNHEDLASVKKSSEVIMSRFDKVDLLVNNAGLSYSKIPLVSAHGKDLAFTVNYLSHFLLTERLLQNLSGGGRIVHVTSTFHWKVDGSELLPDPIPLAYHSDPLLQSPQHVERSYANTKLAQIWHSRSIAEECGVSSVCVCPTWASTGIAGDEARSFLETYAFSVVDCGPGVTSAINGMLRADEELGDALDDGRSFVANSRIVEYIPFLNFLLTSELISQWRDVLANFLAAFLLVGQTYTHEEFIIQETSPESYADKDKRDRFYQWSKEEVKPWL